MANKEYWGPSWLQVELDGVNDWTCSRRIKLLSLKFHPSAAGDVLVIRQVAEGKPEAEWPKIKLESPAGETTGCLFMSGMPMRVNIAPGICVLDDPSAAIITFEYE